MLRRFSFDQHGAAIAEYALLVAILAVALAIASFGHGPEVANFFSQLAGLIQNASWPR